MVKSRKQTLNFVLNLKKKIFEWFHRFENGRKDGDGNPGRPKANIQAELVEI